MAQIIALRDRFLAQLLVVILISMALSQVAVDTAVYDRLRATLEADLGVLLPVAYLDRVARGAAK